VEGKPAQKTDQRDWSKILQAVTMPLGFYVLTLLVVESFLGAVLVFSNLTTEIKAIGMYLGVGIFFGVALVLTSALTKYIPYLGRDSFFDLL
jgi:hypothetical protein